ncbi:hypothetical protein EVAR_72859_1 [Eumeta japonica]|uniref:Uncharacterized protein n=1 Tax=Eumeta variegata TaxID=151549 RepID=A0A4C1SZD4_EUMVA|nr:hypothetical protein EVAR_72859_1 [Eumeta japonica]
MSDVPGVGPGSGSSTSTHLYRRLSVLREVRALRQLVYSAEWSVKVDVFVKNFVGAFSTIAGVALIIKFTFSLSKAANFWRAPSAGAAMFRWQSATPVSPGRARFMLAY